MQRLEFLTGAGAAIAAAAMPVNPFASLETRYGGRLGVFAVDTGSGSVLAHREHERFAMCSTFKTLAVGAVLARVDAGKERLDRRIAYSTRDLLEYAPIAREHVREGSLTVRALCAAAIEYSDNTAANLLLASIGGPASVTRYARSLGDTVTRLDRTEPALNDAIPGDPRDTTSPSSMAHDVRRLLLGDVLSGSSRDLLKTWMLDCKTGTDCIRAGVPRTWRVGDKTGAGELATRNDVAVLWPPRRAPIVVAAYYTGSSQPTAVRNAVLAQVGRIVSSKLA
jgi:beta-lactamase class A